MDKKARDMKVLFFCKKNDSMSEKLITQINSLGFNTNVIYSENKDDKLPEINIENIDFIFSYRSYFILPEDMIKKANYAINFHPGPPQYPGTGCINYALYEGANEYGITVHLMEKLVDTGKIIDLEIFNISKNDSLISLLEKTHNALFSKFVEITKKIYDSEITPTQDKKNKQLFKNKYLEDQISKNENIKWSKIKRNTKDLNNEMIIDQSISKGELDVKFRSFHHQEFPLRLRLHGYNFHLDRKLSENQMNKKIILVGAGGHAKSCIDIIERLHEYSIYGLVDNDLLETEVLGYPVIGNDSLLDSLKDEVDAAFVTVGQIKDAKPREKLFKYLSKLKFHLPVIKSPKSYVSPHSIIQSGTIIMNDCIVNSGTTIGSNCILNNKCLIEHDVKIGDNCHISTGALVNGVVSIGDNTFIGSGTVLKQGINIGSNCVISAGKFINKDLNDGTFLK